MKMFKTTLTWIQTTDFSIFSEAAVTSAWPYRSASFQLNNLFIFRIWSFCWTWTCWTELSLSPSDTSGTVSLTAGFKRTQQPDGQNTPMWSAVSMKPSRLSQVALSERVLDQQRAAAGHLCRTHATRSSFLTCASRSPVFAATTRPLRRATNSPRCSLPEQQSQKKSVWYVVCLPVSLPSQMPPFLSPLWVSSLLLRSYFYKAYY